MGYFANGTEADRYQETYCVKCRNYNDGECAVWLAQEDWQPYGTGNLRGKGHQDVLNALIPVSVSGVDNLQCLMFLPVVNSAEPGEPLREIPVAPRYEVFKTGEKVHLLARRSCDEPSLTPGQKYTVVNPNSDCDYSDNNGPKGAYKVTIQDRAGFTHCLPSTLLARVI